MRKFSKMFLIAFMLANSDCKNKCSDYDAISPYGYLSINYQKKNLNKPYFPANTIDYLLPDELNNLKVTDEDTNGYKISFPKRNDVYQVQIDNYLGSFNKLIENQTFKKTFFIKFKNGDIDTLTTETSFKKDECSVLHTQNFNVKYKQKLINPSIENFVNNIDLTIEK